MSSKAAALPHTSNRALVISLWAAQVFLAVMFGMAGVMKSFMSVPDLTAKGIYYAALFPRPLLRFIGASELLGSIGIVLPALTGIQPQLTWMAALGFTTIQVLAIGFHIIHGDVLHVLPLNLVLLLPSLYVFWGRRVKAPITPR